MMSRTLRRFLQSYAGLLLSIVMICVAAAGSWWGLIPFGRQIWTIYDSRQKILARIALVNEKYTLLSSYSESELLTQSNELLLAIPPDKSIATMIATIEAAVGRGNVNLGSLTIMSPGSLATEAAKRQTAAERELGVGIISSSVTIEGPIAPVRQTLVDFARIRRILSITGMQLTMKQDGSARVNVLVNGYWAPLPTTLSDVAGKITPLGQREEELLRQITTYPALFKSAIAPGSISFPTRSNPFSL